jgi:excisionase family DNA binding protein
MTPIELNFKLIIDEQNSEKLVDVLHRVVQSAAGVDPRAEARLKASQNALFAGRKPPDDRGLSIDTNQAAKLLKVSPRTVWRMKHSGEMPKAIRIGKAVRWGYDEIKQWIDAGCPTPDEWKKQKQKLISS